MSRCFERHLIPKLLAVLSNTVHLPIMVPSTRPHHTLVRKPLPLMRHRLGGLWRLAVGVTLCCVLSACNTEMPAPASGADAPQAAPTPSARIAVDVGVVVADMERSLGFYRDLLGLPIVAEVTTSLIGKGRMVQLAHGTSLIKLVEMDEAPSGGTSKGIPAVFGYRYITLLVADIEPFMTKIEQAEIPITLPLTELGNGAMIVMVEDPDGNIVEFVQEAKE